jgi:hypothetical protein
MLPESLKYRILHGHTGNNPYIEIFKGLTEGGRLSPLLWDLYITDLITTIRRDLPDTVLPSPYDLTLMVILLYVGVMVFHETHKDRSTRGTTQWIIHRETHS